MRSTSEVDATGELTHHHDIQATFDQLALKRTGLGQLRIQQGRAEIAEQSKSTPKSKQGLLGALVAGQIVPLGTPHRAKQHRIRILTSQKGRFRQGATSRVYGYTTREIGGEVKLVLELFPHGTEDFDSLSDDIRSDSITRNQSYTHQHHLASLRR